MYMLPKKQKTKKKIKYPIPPFQTTEMKKIQKKKKKKVKPAEPVTRRHVSERGFIPAVSNGGNEENDKKKTNKNRKWVIFGNKSDRGRI